MNTSNTTLSLSEPTATLLRRTALLPDESLRSLLERLTQLNFYPRNRLLSNRGSNRLIEQGIRDRLAHPMSVETFLQLACLTRLSLEELYAASDHRFAALLVPLRRSRAYMPWTNNTRRPQLEPRRLQSHLRSAAEIQFCPQCLTAATYHRLSWTPRASAVCLEHKCLLVDRCWQCGKRVSITDLLSQRCPLCRADLRQVHGASIAHDWLGIQSQSMIQAWFSATPLPAKLGADCHLPPQPPNVLYHLLQHLVRQLLNAQADWSNLPPPLNGLASLNTMPPDPQRHFAPGQAFMLYRAAFAGLMDWPDGLARWIDAYGGCDSASQSAPRRSLRLRRLQRDWLGLSWRDSPLAFAQPDLVDYFLARRIPLSPSVAERFKTVPWFVERTGLRAETYTTYMLGLSLQALRQLSLSGSLADYDDAS